MFLKAGIPYQIPRGLNGPGLPHMKIEDRNLESLPKKWRHYVLRQMLDRFDNLWVVDRQPVHRLIENLYNPDIGETHFKDEIFIAKR